MNRLVGKLPDQPGIHVAKQQLAIFGARSGAGHAVENPANLTCGKVGIDDQPCLADNHLRRG
jgi:hypothetical protein